MFSRLVLLATAGVEALLAALVPSAWHALADPAPATLPADRGADLVTGGLVLVTAAAWSYWCLVVAVTAGCALAGALPAWLIALPGWSAAAATVLGLGLAVAAGMTPAGGAAVAGAEPAGAARLDGLPLPDRPVGRGSSVSRPCQRPGALTVAPGDSLWALAAGTLPDTAGAERIDRTWRAWYAANRRTIGNDPDLLVPGQHLVPPPRRPLR